MVLLGKLILGKSVEHCHLASKSLGRHEAFSHEHVLTNQLQSRHYHSYGPKQSFQVVRKLRTSSVTWVHSDEDSNCWDQSHLGLKESELLRLSAGKSLLDCFDLCGDYRQHFQSNSVELIETSPETSLYETCEDDS